MLRAEGHPDAHHYPIWKVWSEATTVLKRVNQNIRTQAIVMLQACTTGFHGGMKASNQFKKFLESFGDGEDC